MLEGMVRKCALNFPLCLALVRSPATAKGSSYDAECCSSFHHFQRSEENLRYISNLQFFRGNSSDYCLLCWGMGVPMVGCVLDSCCWFSWGRNFLTPCLYSACVSELWMHGCCCSEVSPGGKVFVTSQCCLEPKPWLWMGPSWAVVILDLPFCGRARGSQAHVPFRAF